MMLSLSRITFPVLFLLSLLFAGCNKNNDAPRVNSPEPEVTPVGDVIGTPISVTIGPAGGTIQSDDQSIIVTFPAGALAAATEIQLQQVRNTCSAGLGKSFRLLPHGTQFLKPVSIQFSYAGLLDSIAAEEALGIAYQDEKGVWQMPGNNAIDKANKKVNLTTNHFSNWTLISWLKIDPTSSVMGVGESRELRVLNFFPIEPGDDLLAPLVMKDDSELPLGKGVDVPSALVKSWSLAGAGNLKGNGGLATYKAPASVNGYTDATATATLASEQHQLLLLAHIRVVGDGITFRVNGGEWTTLQGGASYLDETQSGVSGTSETLSFTIIWPGGEGTFNWDHEPETSATALGYTIENQSTYASFYEDANEEIFKSGGSLKVTKWGNKGEYVTGTFTVQPSGKFSVTTGKQIGTAAIDGYFRLKRVI